MVSFLFKCPMSNVKCQMIVCLWHLFKVIVPSFVIFNLSFVIVLSGCGDLDTELSSMTVSPSSATVGINQSQVFSVIAKDSAGFIIDVDPTWGVTGSIGSIGSTGLFTAGNSSGEGTVVATYGEESASATVSVTENGWLEGRIQHSSFGFQPSIKVYLEGYSSTLNDFSDGDGRYSISNIPAGTYEARTEATTLFQASSMEVTIDKGEITTWDIILSTQPGVPVVPTTTLFTF